MIQAQQLVAFIPQQVASLKAAMTNYVGVANPVGDGAQFDCTFMLTNPDLTGLPTWTGADGWKTEQTGGNSQVMTNGYATSSDGTKTAFYEYWKNPPTQENVFALYLTTTLSKGTYNMSCYAFAQYEQEGLHENRPNGVYFYANDVQGSAVNNARLSEQSIEFVNSTEQVVKIGLKPVEGNGNTWMGIGYVQLFKVPAVTVTIDEDKDYEPESVAGQVTLKRTLSTEKWNTFVVPFQLTNDELKTAFGDGVAVAEFSEEADGDNSIVNLTTMVTPAISPNKPVLLKPATVNNENTYVFADRTIATGEAKVAGEANFDFVGTYAASTTIAGGDYFISQNKLCKSTGATTIKGTRAYIKAKEGSEARIIGFNLDGGETTAVMDIERGTITTGDVYNMAGQKVKKALKGIYIQNGKKVVIK
jgi:hypothetical protein